jgi:hypothetical protein
VRNARACGYRRDGSAHDRRDIRAIHLYFTVENSINSGDGFFLDGVILTLVRYQVKHTEPH